MKFFSILCACSLVTLLNAASSRDIDAFLGRFSGPAYQDIIIDNQVLRRGTDVCEVRYQMITPILDLFTGPFSVLDLGAAQGYFSFKIAHNYPQSTCVMIGANTDYYGNHGDMLYELCHFNEKLSNILYLNKLVRLPDLRLLQKSEHFDVVLALLVIHQIEESLVKRVSVIESLLSLADYVIIEVSNDVAPDLGAYVESLSKKISSIYLGEVRRHYNLDSKATGKLFCFIKNHLDSSSLDKRQVISPETFSKFNGVYP